MDHPLWRQNRLGSPFQNAAIKRVRLMMEEEGHVLRPVTSAMMTTSGLLTSSVEGRLPDTRPPPNLDFFEPDPPERKKGQTPPPTRKITIKPIEESVKRRTPSPKFAIFSADIPTIKPPKLGKTHKVQSTPTTLPTTDVVSFSAPRASSGTKKGKKTLKGKGKATQSGLVTETVGFYVDEKGNKVWICPACSRVDDGSLMIGCDTCDDWYHFTCMGIEAEPGKSEPWYCAKCSNKKARPSDRKRRDAKR